MVVIRTKRDLKAHIKKYLTPFSSIHNVIEEDEVKALTQEFSESSTVFPQPLPLPDTVLDECIHAGLISFLNQHQVSQEVIQRVVDLKPARSASATTTDGEPKATSSGVGDTNSAAPEQRNGVSAASVKKEEPVASNSFSFSALRQHLQTKRAVIEIVHKREEMEKEQRNTAAAAAAAAALKTEREEGGAEAAECKKRRVEDGDQEDAEKEWLAAGSADTGNVAATNLDHGDGGGNTNSSSTGADAEHRAANANHSAGGPSSSPGGSFTGFRVATLDDEDLYADIVQARTASHHHYDTTFHRLPPPPPFQPPQYGGWRGSRGGGPYLPPRRGFRGGGPAGAYPPPPAPMDMPDPHRSHSIPPPPALPPHHRHQVFYPPPPPPPQSRGGPY